MIYYGMLIISLILMYFGFKRNQYALVIIPFVCLLQGNREKRKHFNKKKEYYKPKYYKSNRYYRS